MAAPTPGTAENGGRPPAKARDPSSPIPIPITNANPYSDWLLPSDKRHGDFFNPSKLSLRPNMLSWPKFPHHTTHKMETLCVKFQTTGKCKEGCTYAHINARTDTNQATCDSITTCLQGIYKT